MDLEPIREAAGRVARSLGLEVVDVEWKVGKQRLLRIYIDKPEGISHSDCQAVSEQLSVILDVEDLVPGARYTLEVSSPGLDRKLMKAADYERFVGRLAKIWTHAPVIPGEGSKPVNYLEGRLAGYADGVVRVELSKGPMEVAFDNIRKANLVVEF
ncbi:MAG TPA: ribosome maturation factor RimP [Candidatus Acidoferrales bacterium]|nr:ribosome maturation factor RimP [Candidatus Acidoferrales bacterium]